MAHIVQDMDKKAHSKSSIFNRLNPAKCEHLTPLSIYSRMITCDQKANMQQPRKFSNPFINFKIEILNDYEKKRKFNVSSPDDGYETPAKKVFSPKALSPDLGCFMDFSSPLARQDSVSHFAISEPALLDKTQAIRTETKETVSSQLRCEHVECGSSAEPGANKGTVPHSLKCEKVLLNPAPDFDCEVDDILCLNPLGTYAAGGSDNVESCKSPSSNTFQNKPVIIPIVAHGQELERREGQVEADRQELLMYQNVKDVEEDKGYFSMSYIKNLKLGKNPSQSAYPQLPPAMSSPLLWISDVDAPDDERCHPEGSSEPGCHKQAAGVHVSFTASDLCHVSGPQLGSVNSPVEPLEGDVEEVWNIGPPIFESSMCHSVTMELNAGNEHSRQVSEEVQGGVEEHIQECQAALSKEKSILDTSYESTPPLHVKVKSVVVAPSQHTCSSKPVSRPLPEQNAKTTKPSPNENRGSQTARCVSTSRSQRPATFNVVDWEGEKHLYFHSITRHLNENPGAEQGVMTELRNLMTHVADQTPDTNGRQWQHPSDFTRRNYQRRFGNMMPTMALSEWQAKNSTTYKHFVNVPKIFERSQFPSIRSCGQSSCKQIAHQRGASF